MSVSRTIRIRVLTNDDKLSGFIDNLTLNLWGLKNQSGAFTSIAIDDIGEFEYKSFEDVASVFEILDFRDKNSKLNSINLWNQDLVETINLLIHPLDCDFANYRKHYELNFSLGIGKRICGAIRYTDYSYYLKLLLPKLQSMNCQVCEVECHDYDC